MLFWIASLLAFTNARVEKVVANVTDGYKDPRDYTFELGGGALHPTFFMHGINGHASDFNTAIHAINTYYPGTWTHSIDMYNGSPASWVSLEVQIDTMKWMIKVETYKNWKLFRHGYNLVCHSQGGLLCRTLVEEWDEHNVRNLLSLAGPQEGVYGYAYLESVGFFKQYPWITKGVMDISEAMYHIPVIKDISVAQMWHDTYHLDDFIASNNYLPKLNGVSEDNTHIARYKRNFLKLHKAGFFVGSPPYHGCPNCIDGGVFDGGIEPWHSGAWGFYAPGSNTTFQSMKDRDVYKLDTFGLKTMDQQGKLYVQTYPGIWHGMWEHDWNTLKYHVLPFLD